MKTALAIASLALCAVSLTLQQRAESRHAREVAALRGDLAQVRTLAHEPAPLTRLAPLAARSEPAPIHVPATPPPPTSPTPPAPLAEPLLTAEQASAQVAITFDAQTSDPSWARPTEHTIGQRIQPLLPTGSELRAVACKSALCRVEMSHPNEEALDRFQNDALLRNPDALWRGPLLATRERRTDGSFATVTYLAREGTELPVTP